MDFTGPLPETVAIRYFRNLIYEAITGHHSTIPSFGHLDKRQRRRVRRIRARRRRYREFIAWREAEREAREDTQRNQLHSVLDAWICGFAARETPPWLPLPYLEAVQPNSAHSASDVLGPGKTSS